MDISVVVGMIFVCIFEAVYVFNDLCFCLSVCEYVSVFVSCLSYKYVFAWSNV